jgi:predicted metal-dependent phosphotriesterase family hydrolase
VSVARTVLGDVDASTLGRVDTHEHLMIMGGPIVDRDPDILLDDPDDAILEVEAFRVAGGGTIIDALPTACGRDADALATISRETGVNVVATAGFHRSTSYPERHWARRYPVDLLTSVLLEEVANGIDRWDLAGPVVESTGVRPGVLKLATGHDVIDPIEHRMLRAVAAAHRASGLPILTHAEHGTYGSRQLDLLEEEGVDPARVMVGHVDRLPDLAMHRSLVIRGAFLGYDGLGRERYRPFGVVAEMARQLVAEGFGGQLLLGGDVGRRSMRRSAGGLGVVGVLTTMVPDLVAGGVPEECVDAMLVANAARFLEVREHVY